MNDEKLKAQIGSNIAAFRKRAGLTQSGLGERLNYSDKAVSKWERGESVPDVLTMIQLAEQFEVSVNELLEDPNQLPAEPVGLQKAMAQVSEKALKRKANKHIILGLSSTLVWFVAVLVFVVVSAFDFLEPYSYLAFVYAVPADAVVRLSLRSAWRDFRWNRALISVIMWGSLLSVHLSLMVFCGLNIWRLFLLGIPGQIAIFLWFRMFRKEKKEEAAHG